MEIVGRRSGRGTREVGNSFGNYLQNPGAEQVSFAGPGSLNSHRVVSMTGPTKQGRTHSTAPLHTAVLYRQLHRRRQTGDGGGTPEFRSSPARPHTRA